MFAGHVGAALALKRAERRVNLGVLILAALLLDVLLWLFVLAGLEQVIVPADYASRHYVIYTLFHSSMEIPACRRISLTKEMWMF